jgi:hypothetical protein
VARLVARASELYCQEVAKMRAPQTGLREWLQALRTAGVPCAVTSALSRATVLAVLDAMDIRSFFQAVVTHEDGMESISQRFLSAAVKASTHWKLGRESERCSIDKQVDGAGSPVVEGGGGHLRLFHPEKSNVVECFQQEKVERGCDRSKKLSSENGEGLLTDGSSGPREASGGGELEEKCGHFLDTEMYGQELVENLSWRVWIWTSLFMLC